MCLPNISCDEQNFLRETKNESPNLKIPLLKFYKSMIPTMLENVRFGVFLAKIDICVNSATDICANSKNVEFSLPKFAHFPDFETFGTEIGIFRVKISIFW